MDPNAPERIQINLHHMAGVVLNRRVQRGKGFNPAFTGKAAALIRAKADRNAWLQQTGQPCAMPVFGQINQHIVAARLEGFIQGVIEPQLGERILLTPVSADGVYLANAGMAGQHRLGIVIHQRVNLCVRVRVLKHRKAGRGQ